MGIIVDGSRGEIDSIIIFHVLQSLLLFTLTLDDSSLRTRHEKNVRGVPKDVADEAFLLREF